MTGAANRDGLRDSLRGATQDQLRAITMTGRDVCVVAGAGSGKTFVLTERIVERVLAGVPLRSVLAITFTEKAAAEMRGRLVDALLRAGCANARTDVEGAAVSTIHSFCARMLREHAVEAGVDPAFRVLDEVEADRRRRDALDALVARLAAEDPAGLDLLSTLGGDDPGETLLAAFDTARASGDDPADFVRRADGLPDLDAVADGLRAEAARAAGASLKGESAKKAERWKEAAAALPRAAGGAEAVESALAAFRRQVDAKGSPEFRELAKSMQSSIDAALVVAAEHAIAPLRARVAAAVAELERLYEDAKGRGEELDFADLERRAVALLEARPDVRDAVRRRRPEVLVDEYQDVNPVQARLLDLVATPGRTFVVGDPKQSIYGFRGSDVSVFEARIAAVRAADPEGVVELRTSFRSRGEVLAGVAALFPGGVGSAGPADLSAGRAFAPAGDDPLVEVAGISADGMEEGRRAEAAWIAERVAALVESRAPVAAGKRGEPPSVRPAAFGDVAVLLRSTTHVKLLEGAFVARDIPYVVVKGRGFFHAREVTDLAHLLTAVTGPADDTTLAAVLRSPLAGLSDDGLYALAAARGPASWKGDGPVLRDVLADFASGAPVPGLPPADAEALERFADVLEDLRSRRAFDGVAALVDRALEATDAEVTALARPNGRQRAANLRKVRERALAADAAGRSLSEFVEELHELREREVREAEAATASGDAVRIMTVHASKGLEFPIVFVPDCGRGERAPYDAVPSHPRAGLGLPRGIAPHGEKPWVAVRAAEAREAADRAESDRLLYVAATRAEERLVLTGTVSQRNDTRPWWDRIEAMAGAVPAAEERVVPAGAARIAVRVIPPGAAGEAPRPRTLLARVTASLAAGEVPETPRHPDAEAAAQTLLAESLRRARDADHAPFQTTVSALVAFDRCPQEYRLRHVLGVPEPSSLGMHAPATAFDPAPAEEPREPVPGDDEDDLPASDADMPLDARAVGRAAHAALERLVPRFEHEGRGGDEAVRAVVAGSLRAETGGAPPHPALVERVARWVADFRDGPVGREVRAAQRGDVRREQGFLLRLGPTVVRGQVDLLVRGPGGTTVVDYKAGDTGAASRAHRVQMLVYALAIEGVEGRLPARAALWSLPGGRAIDVDVSPASAAEIRAGLLAEFGRRTTAGDFVPAGDPPCSRCAYRGICGFAR